MAQEVKTSSNGQAPVLSPPAEWADTWLKTTGIRTSYREREILIQQFENAMKAAVEWERLKQVETKA